MPLSDLRVGNAERTEVIALLTRALDSGHLALPEYDGRIAAVSIASHVSDLAVPLRDLPPEFGWLAPGTASPAKAPPSRTRAGKARPSKAPPVAAPTPDAPQRDAARYGRISLILGIVSVPLSVCFVGWVFGILALVYGTRAGSRGFSAALIGKVLGIVSILLTVAAGAAVFFASGSST
jgi:uncharacterized protein DUF1707